VTDENLVVFPSPVVEPLYRRSQLISDHARTKDLISALWRGSVVPRAVAESESSMTQAVAYATLRCGSDLVCLRRRSALRAELDGRWTIVFGGHVNSDERDGLQGLRRCLMRELREEFGLLRCKSVRFIGIAADPGSQVGRQHLGFMFEAEVPAESVYLDRRFDNHDYSLIPGHNPFSEIERLLATDEDHFDPWSRLVLGAYR
jgi:predicted NUDIX family phosphoesterase